MNHKFVIFPFTAIIGQDLMKKALLINAIDPLIGGVLINGDKGTGKSTAVRALMDLLPKIKVVKDCPFNCDPENLRLMCPTCQKRFKEEGKLPWIERRMEIIDMPLSATEDMVVGTIDIKKALKEGVKALEPGILAKANRNILYIDEVNLLDDHLANILLDAAAMGVNIIEREGISIYHPSRFILVGTMNPEEGDLRPQLLDRFGLCVNISALTNKEDRMKVVKYRSEFDKDPWKFESKFKNEIDRLREKIAKAQMNIDIIDIPDEILEKIVEITISLGIKTHRADIVMEKVIKALMALDGRNYVIENDLIEATQLALNHRLRQDPFDKRKQLTPESIQKMIRTKVNEEVFDFDRQGEIKNNLLNSKIYGISKGKDLFKINSERGLYIKARNSDKPKNIAIDATIRKSVRENGKLEILPEHLMEKIRIGKSSSLYIILLDSSSSMRIDKKIKFAKTLSWLLLKKSYEGKNKVGLISFRGENARILVNPTRDMIKIEEALQDLPTGGKTPLTIALYKAIELANKYKNNTPTIVLISDGKGNVFIKNNIDEDIKFLNSISNNTNFVIINAENRYKSIGILEKISKIFNASHFYLEEIM
ncbi:MAG: VWA domain-containing protein [Candidatus Helarchaeota archaeon]